MRTTTKSFSLAWMEPKLKHAPRGTTGGVWFLLLSLSLAIHDVVASSQAEVDKHLELGRDMLARGQLQDALSHYHAAVEGDPSNYLTYFKRGTVYLALGKAKFALSDLTKVLELKPDFTAARMQRAQVLLKQGDLDEAEEAFESVLRVQPDHQDALVGLRKIAPLKHDITVAKSLAVSGDHSAAINMLTSVMDSCPWDMSLRELRGASHLALGDVRSAISDVRSATKLTTDHTEGFLQLALLHYGLGEAEASLREVRECLRLDGDHPECFSHYKIVKKVAKAFEEMSAAWNSKDYQRCITEANKVLRLENKVDMIQYEAHEHLCRCYRLTNELSSSLTSCGAALAIQRVPHVLCDRAETFIASEMYDDAIHDYQAALELDEGLQRAREGLTKSQKLQKQSERRDYYKILSVSRSATKKEIVKAYRRAAQQWHPDNFHGDEKKLAEKKFIDIAAAKEVLTDPEKRQKFDDGEDPLDPESQQNQGFHPFHHFHGSPFQFKFHFN